MRTGHLFAGIDGIGLGLEPHGFETAWFSEYEDAPSRVLAHHYPDIPNHGDITAIDWTEVEPVDVLTGGFPCQDLSYAGKGAGIKEGTRSGLWFEYVRAIRALRPRLVIVENVPALATRGLDIVLRDLHESGLDAEWSTLRASDVGAAHRRERLFIVATATDGDVRGHVHREPGVVAAEAGVDAFRDAPASGRTANADPNGLGLEGAEHVGQRLSVNQLNQYRSRQAAADGSSDGRAAWRSGADKRPWGAGLAPCDWEATGEVAWGDFATVIRRWERTIGRSAPAPTVDGRLSADFVEWHMGFPAGWTAILPRNQRLKALGNAVVPQVAAAIGRWAADIKGHPEPAPVTRWLSPRGGAL